MNKEKATIEKIVWSKISHKTRFSSGFSDIKEILNFRKDNMEITKMCWITLEPVIDCTNTLYNPNALIMLILN